MTGRRVKTIAEFGRAGRVVNDLKASHDRLYEALDHAVSVIRRHVPMDALGMAGEPGEGWPLLEEYLSYMDAALLSASTKEGGE